MPKRWLSRNGRHNDRLVISSPKGLVLHDNHTFDFAFTDLRPLQTDTSLSALPPSTLDHGRPTTSAGVNERSRKKIHVDTQHRPKSSSGPLSPSVIRANLRPTSRSDDNLIGVAIGSPGQPPMAFCNDEGGRNSPVFDHVSDSQSSTFDQKPSGTKWKKLGSLFRTKPGLVKSKSGILREDHGRPYEPTPRQHFYEQHAYISPARLPPSIRVQREPSENVHQDAEPKTVLDLQPSPPVLTSPGYASTDAHLRKQTSLPRLCTAGPTLRNLPTNGSTSSLLARRSRTLENLKSSTFLRVSSDDERSETSNTTPRSARRQTTPTMAKPPSIVGLNGSSTSVGGGKYSLFPATANGRVDHRSPSRTRLGRSNTSPARLSPMQPQFTRNQYVVHPRREDSRTDISRVAVQTESSPEEHTASTTKSAKTPWSAAHSLQSSVSSTSTMEEIFFDIRTLRDSQGVEKNDHFVMTRPDSVAVSLARTRSKLNASSRTNKPPNDQVGTDGGSMMAQRSVVGVSEEIRRLRIEEEMLREIETRVQRQLKEKREKELYREQNPHILPTPDLGHDDPRFSVTTAIFDETIAAVEAMSRPTAKPCEALVVSIPSKPSNPGPQINALHNSTARAIRSESPAKTSARNKLLPPDPGMPIAQQSRDVQRDARMRATPSPNADAQSGATLTPQKVRGASRTPSPNALVPTGDRQAQGTAQSTTARQQETSKPVQRKAVPPPTSGRPVPGIAASPTISVSSDYSQASRPPSSAARSTANSRLRVHDIPIEESPTIPQSPGPGKHNPNRATLKEKPPPVPDKDTRFIPISKFAAKNTITKVEQAGIRPTRLNRSATDSIVGSPLVSSMTADHRSASHGSERPVRPTRSGTVPSAKSPSFPPQQYKPSPRLGDQSIKSSPQLKDSMTVVQAKSVAEVSVARAMSVTRKASARVIEPSPRLLARRAEEEAKTKAQNDKEWEREREREQARLQGTRSTTPAGLGLLIEDMPGATTTTAEYTTHHHHEKNPSTSSIDRDRRAALSSNPSTPDWMTGTETAEERAQREKAQKAAIVEAAKARARERRRRAEDEAREQAERLRVEGLRDSQRREGGSGEGARWEIVERNRAMSPLLVEGMQGHRVGRSVNVVVEGS